MAYDIVDTVHMHTLKKYIGGNAVKWISFCIFYLASIRLSGLFQVGLWEIGLWICVILYFFFMSFYSYLNLIPVEIVIQQK